MDSIYRLELSKSWVTVGELEKSLCHAGEPHAESITDVDLILPVGCKVMVDAGTLLLSLLNQLADSGRRVIIRFEEGERGVMGYLNRICFFDWLHPDIRTVPDRPSKSGAALYGKTNLAVVEFVPINTRHRDEDIPSQLSNALEAAYVHRSDRKALGQAAFTVFGELIDNIFEHSLSALDGYAALQVYKGKNGTTALAAVSDSGQGILESLRPSLIGTSLAVLSDPELIVHMLNEGVSRYGDERGCGLKQSAEHALKYKAELTIRLPTASLHLIPSIDGYGINRAYGRTSLPRIMGTHLAFRFQLDKS